MAQAHNDNRNRDKKDRGAKNQESNKAEIAQLNTPPHSMEAEQAVLGSIMQSVDAWDKIAEILIQEDFYNRAHRLVFAAITRLIAKNSAADPITLKDELESNNELEDVGGFTYIVNLARNTPSSSNITAYANIVRERAIVRELIGAANEIADASFNPEGRDSKELLDLAETKVFEIAEKRTAANEGPISVSGALRKTIARIEELAGQDKEVTGVSTGFNDLDSKTSGMQPSDLIIVAARPSMGKCIVSGSQLVDPENGRLVTIDELVATQSGRVSSLNNDFKFEQTHASAFVDDGIKPVFKVTTALGKEIQTTLSHPFLCADGWQPLADIKCGEQIAIPRTLPIFGKRTLANHEVKAIAYVLVDRYLVDKFNVETSISSSVKEDVCLVHRPVNALIANDAQQAYLSSFECSEVFETFFEEHLAQVNDKHLPSIIFSLTKAQVALLLNRIFSCDGQFFVGDREHERASVRLRYNTQSKTLATQIQHLLLRFGIMSKLRVMSSSAQYSLSLLSNQDVSIYLREIGFYGKDKDVASAKALLAEHNRPCESDILPISVVAYVNKLKGDKTWQQCLLNDGRLAALNVNALDTQISRSDAAILADVFDDSYLLHLSHSDLYWDKVVSIEAQGEKQVYDLTVPGLHNFIAQDICVHNTTFAMNLVENALLLEEKPVLVFSLEMPAEQIMMRMLASLSRVNQTSVRTARLEDSDWARIQSSVKMLNDKDNLFIDDSSGLTPMEVRTRARKLARDRGGISMIMIDYLQLMRVPSLSENRTLEIAEISRSLKSLAKELQCPVIALSQLNRGLEQRADKRPINSDLRESGSIEQDADLIMFIYRDEVYHENSDMKGIAEIIIGKQRNGPIGTTRLTFQGQFSRFDNYAGPAYDEE